MICLNMYLEIKVEKRVTIVPLYQSDRSVSTFSTHLQTTMDDSFEVFVCASPNHITMPKEQFERVLCSLHKKVRIGSPFKKLHIKKFFELESS